MLQNSKFRDLVDNVFSNIQCVEVSGQLKEIFSKSNTVTNLYIKEVENIMIQDFISSSVEGIH